MWENQDAHRVTLVDSDKVVVVVCDGHNFMGKQAAEVACTLLTQSSVAAVRQAPETHAAALRDAFLSTHRALEARGLGEAGGCTATVALVDAAAQTLTSAHVGDSRLAILRGGQVLFETADHSFGEEDIARVRRHGGDVREETCSGLRAPRVYWRGSDGPGLAMSRSLGDTACHHLGVLAEPSVHSRMCFAPGSTLLVASDGVWEHMPSSSAARAVESAKTSASPAALASQGLVDGARGLSRRRTNADDVTAVVVNFTG